MPVNRIPTFLSSAFTFGSHDNAERRARLKLALARLSAPVLRARLKAIVDVDVSDKLAALKVPILYLRGTSDLLVYRTQSEVMRRRAPAMEIREFAAPHFILQTRPREAAQAIREFMSGRAGDVMTMQQKLS